MAFASPRPFRSLIVVGAIAIAALGVACSDDARPDADPTEGTTTATATASTTAEATSTATTAPGVDPTQAVPEDDASLEAYSALVEDVAAAFPDVTLIEDTGSYAVGDLVGDGRRVLVFGSAADLPTFVEVQQTLRGILEDDGWTEDIAYAADGPTGTLSVWTKGDDTAVVSAGVAPRDPSACPPDQVISACLSELDPADLDVQGSISVAIRAE